MHWIYRYLLWFLAVGFFLFVFGEHFLTAQVRKT
jgi:hypothetical protein